MNEYFIFFNQSKNYFLFTISFDTKKGVYFLSEEICKKKGGVIMARRYQWPFNGNRFIGNINTNEVHDLDNEKTLCRIDEIKPYHVKTFIPDTLEQAKREGFDNCAHCLGNSKY